jgi:hypothetical protein
MSDAKNQAKAHVKSIVSLIQCLNWDWDGHDVEDELPHPLDYQSREEVEQAIQEKPLSVEVREHWHAVGEKVEAVEFRILLCWGGPSVEIRGVLGLHGHPENVKVFYAEWGDSGEYVLSEEEREAVEQFCQQFYFGE